MSVFHSCFSHALIYVYELNVLLQFTTETFENWVTEMGWNFENAIHALTSF